MNTWSIFCYGLVPSQLDYRSLVFFFFLYTFTIHITIWLCQSSVYYFWHHYHWTLSSSSSFRLNCFDGCEWGTLWGSRSLNGDGTLHHLALGPKLELFSKSISVCRAVCFYRRDLVVDCCCCWSILDGPITRSMGIQFHTKGWPIICVSNCFPVSTTKIIIDNFSFEVQQEKN